MVISGITDNPFCAAKGSQLIKLGIVGRQEGLLNQNVFAIAQKIGDYFDLGLIRYA